eukprot:GCRY01002685.1.p1 GENE.GCRY01002685.1~~GCRY01002685.1.p1  ORF type:complete len:303 (-),score=35.38 GCRY01002685.1:63-887(-)
MADCPALPPHLVSQLKNDSDEEIGAAKSTKARMIGPSFPSQKSVHVEESESEDDCGPSKSKFLQSVNANLKDSDDEVFMPTFHDEDALLRHTIQKQNEDSEEEVTGPQHEEWMTQLPDRKTLGIPTKSQTSFSKRTVKIDDSERKQWTETPAQRAKRERNENLRESTDVSSSRRQRSFALENQKADEFSEQYNKSYRPTTLLEEHQKTEKDRKKKKKRSKEKKDTVETAPFRWNYDEMMSIGSNRLMDDEKHAKTIAQAQGLSSRFSNSSKKYL